MDRDEARAINTAISNTGVVAGAAIGGIVALCRELQLVGVLDDDAVARVEKTITSELNGMPDITARSRMRSTVHRAFEAAKS